MLQWLRDRAGTVGTLAAVCTGSMLLGAAGLLDGLHATTHWRSLGWMQESFPAVFVETDQHVVEDGRVITSAGISAGIDMALRVVVRFSGLRGASPKTFSSSVFLSPLSSDPSRPAFLPVENRF